MGLCNRGRKVAEGKETAEAMESSITKWAPLLLASTIWGRTVPLPRRGLQQTSPPSGSLACELPAGLARTAGEEVLDRRHQPSHPMLPGQKHSRSAVSGAGHQEEHKDGGVATYGPPGAVLGRKGRAGRGGRARARPRAAAARLSRDA